LIDGDWGLGIVDWGLGIGANPQSPFTSFIFKNLVKNFLLKYFIDLIIYYFSKSHL